MKPMRRFMFERNLFMENMFPRNVDRVLYLDSDQIIFGDIEELYSLDMEDKTIGMVVHCNNSFSMFTGKNLWTMHL